MEASYPRTTAGFLWFQQRFLKRLSEHYQLGEDLGFGRQKKRPSRKEPLTSPMVVNVVHRDQTAGGKTLRTLWLFFWNMSQFLDSNQLLGENQAHAPKYKKISSV
jgi:hypothetical protein